MNTFKVTSGELIVTDPCYEKGTWCTGIVKNVMLGDWKGNIVLKDEKGWGIRVATLMAHHSSIKEFSNLDWKLQPFEVGVDSGQAGIFDNSKYPTGNTGDYGDTTTFYGRVCETTLSETQWGTMPEGVVSSSGFGDGGYNCYTVTNEQGMVVAVKIIFIGESEEDYAEEEENSVYENSP